MRDPQRDPRKAFRQTLSNHQQSMSTPRPAAALRSATLNEDGTMPNKPIGIVGPIASGGLAMPNVERAFAKMENGSEDLTSDMDAKVSRIRHCLDQIIDSCFQPQSEPRTPLPNSTKRSMSSTEANSSPSSNELLNNFVSAFKLFAHRTAADIVVIVPRIDSRPTHARKYACKDTRLEHEDVMRAAVHHSAFCICEQHQIVKISYICGGCIHYISQHVFFHYIFFFSRFSQAFVRLVPHWHILLWIISLSCSLIILPVHRLITVGIALRIASRIRRARTML